MIEMAAIDILWIILACIGSYLLGSIPTSVWLGQLVKGKDLRDYNTGNPGAMNAVRTFGITFGYIVLLLDCFKGTLAIALIDHIFSLKHFIALDGSNIYHTFMCILGPGLCVIGHNYPIWLKFNGGQGLGVFVGTLFYFNPLVMIAYSIFFMFLTLAFKMPVRYIGTIVVLLCIPVALILPIGPPWSNILMDWVIGANGFLHLTSGLIVLSLDIALLIRLLESVKKKIPIGRETETG